MPVSKIAVNDEAPPSTGAGMLPSIGVQGMRVLSSLKVAGWNLAGGGGARSAHVMKDDKEPQMKDTAGATLFFSSRVAARLSCSSSPSNVMT